MSYEKHDILTLRGHMCSPRVSQWYVLCFFALFVLVLCFMPNVSCVFGSFIIDFPFPFIKIYLNIGIKMCFFSIRFYVKLCSMTAQINTKWNQKQRNICMKTITRHPSIFKYLYMQVVQSESHWKQKCLLFSILTSTLPSSKLEWIWLLAKRCRTN